MAALVSPSDSLPHALGKVVTAKLRQLKKHAGRIGDETDPEEVHDARVATRRIRAALDTLSDGSGQPKRKVRSELRRVGRRLGAVRDLDVLLGVLDEYNRQQDAAERAALEPLSDAWQRERREGLTELLDELHSERYHAMEEGLAAWAEPANADTEDPTDPRVTVRLGAPSRIFSAYERFAAYQIDPCTAPVEVLHRLRIAAKKLRYAMEAFEEVLDPTMGRLIKEVEALQDDAGLLHDAAVAASKACTFNEQLKDDSANATTASVERFAASRDAEVSRLRTSLGNRLPKLVGREFRRDLATTATRLDPN